MGVALEFDPHRLAHRRAAAVAADQVGRRDPLGAGRGLDIDLDAVVMLLEARQRAPRTSRRRGETP